MGEREDLEKMKEEANKEIREKMEKYAQETMNWVMESIRYPHYILIAYDDGKGVQFTDTSNRMSSPTVIGVLELVKKRFQMEVLSRSYEKIENKKKEDDKSVS